MSNALGKYAASQKSERVATPNTKRSVGRTDEVQNNTGGFTFKVSEKDRIERFMILGTDKGTYYVGQRKLTDDNVKFLKSAIAKDERLVVDTAVDVSVNGRALKNSPALFAMALVMNEGKDKAYAREAVQKVARTSTHLFEYGKYLDGLGGWGRSKRQSIASWYEDKSTDDIAYQAVKYRQRDGWTHRDLFRLAHPKGVDQNLGNFILGKLSDSQTHSVQIVAGFQAIQKATSVKQVVTILGEYKNLPWEAIPTQFLKSAEVWKTLFYNGQLRGQALIRNLTRLARIGAFDDMVFVADVAEAITDQGMIQKTRLHPINFLNAAVVFESGSIDRSSGGYSWYGHSRKKDWTTNGKVKDALNEGFHLSFKSVQPANKRTLVGVDVSGSMSCSAIGLDLSCAQVSAAVSMTVARTEPYSDIVGFSSQIVDLGISARDSLDSAMRKVSNRNFGSTDPAKAIQYALERKIAVDTFVIVTDNETNCGHQKPFQALKEYRQKTGIDARLAVLGVASTDFTVADGNDKGMMDFAGFDSSAPKALADFSAGRI